MKTLILLTVLFLFSCTPEQIGREVKRLQNDFEKGYIDLNDTTFTESDDSIFIFINGNEYRIKYEKPPPPAEEGTMTFWHLYYTDSCYKKNEK